MKLVQESLPLQLVHISLKFPKKDAIYRCILPQYKYLSNCMNCFDLKNGEGGQGGGHEYIRCPVHQIRPVQSPGNNAVIIYAYYNQIGSNW